MKVLLINPGGGLETRYWPPLGLGYIGACLERGGHEVRLLDREVIFREKQTIELVDQQSGSVIKDFQPDMIGITSITPTIPDAFHVAALAKRLLPKIPVVLGGVHASILPKETLEASPDIDIAVKGEGEVTMRELCDGTGLESVAGIFYRKNGDIVANPDRNCIANLDDLPFPARHLYDMNRYLERSPSVVFGIEARATHLFSSRGCPYRCTFCAGSGAFGAKVRFISPRRIVEEIERIVGEYSIDGLYFSDDMFAAQRKRTIEICRLLIEHRLHRKILWAAQMRVHPIDEELLRLMKKAGCVQVQYGFESGSERILDLMDKRTTVRQNYEAAALTRKVGLTFAVNVIVGFPSETRDDFLLTVKLLEATRPDFIGMHRFVPFPGSEIFNELRQKKLLDRDWSKYHVGLSHGGNFNFTTMTDEEFNGLFIHFQQELVARTNSRSYFTQNLTRRPFRIIQKIRSFNASPQRVARGFAHAPLRTLRSIVSRFRGDPVRISGK